MLQRMVSVGGGPRGFAAEQGREGTSGNELDGDPNRAPQKKGEGGEKEEEGKDDIMQV